MKIMINLKKKYMNNNNIIKNMMMRIYIPTTETKNHNFSNYFLQSNSNFHQINHLKYCSQ
jgi:hypothetical protein